MSADESRPRCIDDPSRPCHNDLGSHGPREIHYHPVSGDPIDLYAIEARALAFPEYDREWHTDGPWWQDDENGVATGDSMVSGFERCAVVTPPPPLHQRLEPVSYVMEHIAGMDPATTLALVAEVRRLRRWKDEALPVMEGLQELGGALGLPLGTRITGRQAVDAALDLRSEARRLRGEWDPNELIYGVGD